MRSQRAGVARYERYSVVDIIFVDMRRFYRSQQRRFAAFF
jgi:hypothetical protein